MANDDTDLRPGDGDYGSSEIAAYLDGGFARAATPAEAVRRFSATEGCD